MFSKYQNLFYVALILLTTQLGVFGARIDSIRITCDALQSEFERVQRERVELVAEAERALAAWRAKEELPFEVMPKLEGQHQDPDMLPPRYEDRFFLNRNDARALARDSLDAERNRAVISCRLSHDVATAVARSRFYSVRIRGHFEEIQKLRRKIEESYSWLKGMFSASPGPTGIVKRARPRLE